MPRKLLTFSFFVFVCIYGFSQTLKKFDEDVEKYPETVVTMFTAKIGDKEQAVIAKFTGEWNGGTFTNNEKVQILQLSNAFLEKKARNIHFLSLWQCLMSFKTPENNMKGYGAWMEAMIATCQNRRTTPTALQSLMTATQDLLDRQVISSSPGNEWKSSTKDYRFDFKDNQLVVVFGTSDISCLAKGDSIMIAQTTGRFLMSEQQWIGQGGTVTWERCGFSKDEIFARLGSYTIQMNQSQYEADSVWLTHKTYFPTPVQGKLIDKVRHNMSPDMAIYPEFITYNKTFVFENLYPDISYRGGITVQGARTIGSGTDEEKALIRVAKGDSIRMDVASKGFVFRNDRINARNVSLSIHLSQDSMYHANLSFVYLVANKEVSFLRSDAASSQAPYNDSYHKLDMDFEQLVWRTDEPVMNLSMTRGSSVGRARFRSHNYFDQRYFESLQYFDAVHPLISIKKCADAYYSETFPAEAYSRYIRKPITTARSQLIEIAKLGYIVYNADTDEATIQPRLYEILSAAAKKSDFDVIDLRSNVQSPAKNAVLDIANYDLTIHGIEKFVVSDSQKVVIQPRKQQIVVKQNRNIDIDGRIDAGQLELYGDSLRFDYDAFKVDLSHVDSLFIYVPSEKVDAFSKPVLRKVKSALEQVTGTILIDLPDNKSGRKSMSQYPILRSDSASLVHYGSSNIEGGAYTGDSFYFEVDPFVLDSIDNFGRETVVLPGRFVSADIFNEMRQELRIQPDYSLGFTYNTGDSSIAAYKNAKMSAEIRLSNQGLEASGQLDYLTASIHTDVFKIYPDSLNVPKAKEFFLKKQVTGTEYPEVRSEGNKIHWEPHQDKMYIYKYQTPFDMYNHATKLDGDLLLTPEGLSGAGLLDMATANIRSDDIDFKANSFHADTSLFRLKSNMNEGYQLITVDKIQSDIDYNTRQGQFKPHNDYALVQFPEQRFAAYVDDFSWNMDSAKIHIGAKPSKPAVDFKYRYPGEGNGARYYATSRDADSLNFVAESATFDYGNGRLKAEGVRFVKTADALVYPGNGKVTVSPGGTLEAIQHARIILSEDTIRRHLIHSAEVKIYGRKKYSGVGKYDYIDETGKISVVDITQIAADKNRDKGKDGKSVATGTIPESSDFMLSPFYRFQGNITLSSDQPLAGFDGLAQIVEECPTFKPEWFSFKSYIDPNQIKLSVGAAPTGLNNRKLYNGLFITTDSTHIYPAFFSARKRYSDHPLIQADGVLYYDKELMIYYLAPEGKLKNQDTIGNLIAFNRDKCLLSGEGTLSLGVDLGRVEVDAVGQVTHDLNSKETTLDVMMSFDFLFDDGLAAIIAGKIDSFPSVKGVDMSRTQYIRGTNQWLGVANAAIFRRNALMGKVRNFPEELKQTLVLTQLNLYWNQATRSYRSTGPIGVGNLFGHQVNRLVDGMVEISKRPGGDMLDIYLKIDGNNWFYFGYTRELMQIISSDQKFNNRLMSLSEKQRKSEEKRPGYTYMIASSDKLNQFLRQSQSQNQPQTTLPDQPAFPINQPIVPDQSTETRDQEEAPIIEIE